MGVASGGQSERESWPEPAQDRRPLAVDAVYSAPPAGIRVEDHRPPAGSASEPVAWSDPVPERARRDWPERARSALIARAAACRGLQDP